MADPTVLAKIDAGLAAALEAWEELNQPDDAKAGITVSLSYEGDLASIEALGFVTHVASPDTAHGIVYFKDLPALTAHPGVLWIAAGQPPKVTLDTAVHEIKVRASAAALSDGLWHVPTSGTPLTNAANATGEGVIVAIIDTGIDYKHPMFMSQLTPRKETRILKIWDQGLSTSFADCPSQTRLFSPNTYGVEYDETEIEDDLNGGTAILHRDCIGHGTHVAGIAAGGPLPFSSGTNAEFVGVAPKASIIAVKVLDVPDPIFYRMPDNSVGTQVGWDYRFKDAVLYCLRSAKHDFADKPIVINMSFGSNSLPGDGLDALSVWVDDLMNPALAASDDHFPTRAIIVKSAGNDGPKWNDGTDRRLTARIVVPAGGTITVPLRLRDVGDGTARTDWKECLQRPHRPTVGAHFWYRATTAPLAVQFSFRIPNASTFAAPVSPASQVEVGFLPVVGPPPSVNMVAASSAVYRVRLSGDTPVAVPHPGGAGSVRRNHMTFLVKPKELGTVGFYHTGIYEVQIAAPAGTEFFLLCEMEAWNSARFMWFEIATTLQNGNPLPAGITEISTGKCSATDTLGMNVITVASYDDLTGNIAGSSSRGPLRNFAEPASGLAVIAAKPDIGAPGVDINSARSIDTASLAPVTPNFSLGRRFWEMGGTSMAAPMITGLIALRLHKNPNSSITDIRAALLAGPRTAVNPASPPASTQAYGAGRVDGMTTHSHT